MEIYVSLHVHQVVFLAFLLHRRDSELTSLFLLFSPFFLSQLYLYFSIIETDKFTLSCSPPGPPCMMWGASKVTSRTRLPVYMSQLGPEASRGALRIVVTRNDMSDLKTFKFLSF